MGSQHRSRSLLLSRIACTAAVIVCGRLFLFDDMVTKEHLSWSEESAQDTGLNGTRSMETDSLVKLLSQDDLEPGHLDSKYFAEDSNVAFWRDFKGSDAGSGILSILTDVMSNPEDLWFWMYSLTRSTFFGMQGASALLFARGIHAFEDWKALLGNDPLSMLSECIAAYHQDLSWQKQLLFKQPYDMSWRHRQFNPFYMLHQVMLALVELAAMLQRRFSDETDITSWMQNDFYPDYYQHTFHFQPDGWLSAKSAETYEHSSETAFVGMQDTMQRTTFLPLVKFMEGWTEARAPKVLEVGSGTGRFATFLKDNFPAVDLTVSDLSPFYLDRARTNMQHWKRITGVPAEKIAPVSYMWAAAESIPAPAGSYDVILCQYLFHEIPPEARRKVAKEAARLLRPGGMFILTDSFQRGDRPYLEERQAAYGFDFEQHNEPYYTTYLWESFGEMFTKDGAFVGGQKYMSAITKTLSFMRI